MPILTVVDALSAFEDCFKTIDFRLTAIKETDWMSIIADSVRISLQSTNLAFNQPIYVD